MIKYEMTVDNEIYNALFVDHFEASDFLDELDKDGCEVIVNRYYDVTVNDILNDRDFDYPYKVEMIATMCLPNHETFKKWFEQEAELKKLGIL